jgi:hypothetical protein
MDYHRFITDPSRTLSAADRMDVFGGGMDPAGLGTLGAPVNPAHVFEYLGENLPPSGNPKDFIGRGGARWARGAQDVYGGKYITETQSRFSPNTKTITVEDAQPVVMRPDELTEIKNNSQIVREMTQNIGSVRMFPARPNANHLAEQVSADAEARNTQDQAVALVYESQMDAIRASHLGARARGAALRGETIGAMSSAMPLVQARKPMLSTSTVRMQAPAPKTMVTLYPVVGKASSPPAGSSDPVPVSFTTGENMSLATFPTTSNGSFSAEEAGMGETYVDTRFEPTKVAMILGGVAVAAVAAYFLMRK